MFYVDDPSRMLPQLPSGWQRIAPEELATFPGRFLVCGFLHPDAVVDHAAYDAHYRRVFTACRDRAIRILPLSAERLAADVSVESANLLRLLQEVGVSDQVDLPVAGAVPPRVAGSSPLTARTWYGKLAFNRGYGPMAVLDFRTWDFEVGSCDLCGASDTRELVFDVHASGHDLHECTGCGLMYYRRRVPFRGQLEHTLANDTNQAKVFEEQCTLGVRPVVRSHQEAHLRTYYQSLWQGSLEFFSACQPGKSPTTAFDLGCGSGFALQTLQEMQAAAGKPSVQMAGCELNRACAAASVSRGIDCEACAFEDWHAYGRTFDLVCTFDFLEHTYTPFSDLKRMVAAMSPGGVLVAKTFVQELDCDCTMMAPPGHSHHFTERLLVRMLELAGLRLARVDRAAPMVTLWAVKRPA